MIAFEQSLYLLFCFVEMNDPGPAQAFTGPVQVGQTQQF